MNENQLKNFVVINKFLGYRNKRDVTKTEPGFAVSGSQNIQIIDSEKVGVRAGTSFLGARSTDLYGIEGGGSWKTNTGTEIAWRSYTDGTNGNLEVYVQNAWRTLKNDFSDLGKFRSTTWWDSTEVEDLLLLVNGDANIYMWSGGVATFSAATVNTLTLEGTATWAESRFLTAGTRGGRVLDDTGTWREFTYTGGEGTTTLTGVSVDLTTFAISAGQPILQSIRTTSNTPSANKSNDFLATYLNYILVFDEQKRTVEMSTNTDYTDFSAPVSPRLPGTAGSFTLDEAPTAAITQPDGDALYISTKNQWYQFVFTPSADLTKEEITITPLKTSALEGATNSLAVSLIKNNVVTVNGEPTIDTLGRVADIDTPQSTPLSDEIKKYMDAAGVTTSAVSFYKNNIYIAIKESSSDGANNRILIRNLATGSWEAPWTFPASVIFEYAGDLYCHDPNTKNTYKLFDDSYSDLTQKDTNGNVTTNGAPIIAKWYSSHEDYGFPFNQKTFDKIWIDGYIRPSTELDIVFTYDFGKQTKKYTLVGTNTDVVITPLGGGLGYYNLGSRNLGGRGESLAASGLRRFRGFISIPEVPFYELQVSFQSNGIGYRWEVTSFGMNIRKKLSQDNNLLIA